METNDHMDMNSNVHDILKHWAPTWTLLDQHNEYNRYTNVGFEFCVFVSRIFLIQFQQFRNCTFKTLRILVFETFKASEIVIRSYKMCSDGQQQSSAAPPPRRITAGSTALSQVHFFDLRSKSKKRRTNPARPPKKFPARPPIIICQFYNSFSKNIWKRLAFGHTAAALCRPDACPPRYVNPSPPET